MLEYGMYDDENLTVTLTLDDDEDLPCTVVAVFPAGNNDYIALLPLNGEDENVFLYRFAQSEDGELDLCNIEDDEEFDRAAEAYDCLLSNADFDVFVTDQSEEG